ncbi:MAG: hypothetical protein VZQ55_05490 [Ruminococcus sp.]|nr:hypothetical protein [Ruminococcus sp.]
MYINVLTFSNGKTIGCHTETPFSIDKLSIPNGEDPLSDWNTIFDEVNHESVNFRTSELVTIASAKLSPEEARKKKSTSVKNEARKNGKKANFKADITKA